MKKVKFAVVGFGHIGKKHVEVITQNNNAELTAIIDVESARNHQINQPFFSSIKNFLQSEIETDVINIATPNGLHAAQAIECLNANKHVVVEKPMTLNTTDAQRIINAADKMQKHVFVVMQLRYSPIILWLKKLVAKNVLGKIFMVQMNCFWNRDERYYKTDSWHGIKELGGVTLFTQFSHFTDVFYWLFGDIKKINAKFQSFNHQQLTAFEDSGLIHFEFGNDSLGSLNFSTSVYDKNMESSITIIAENGSIKIGGQYMNSIEYCHLKNYAMPQITSNENLKNHQFIIQNVIDVLNGKDAIKANAFEGMKVIEIIERIYNSAKNIF